MARLLKLRALHVGAMWNLAVAHPLLGALGGSPELFVSYRSHALDVLLFTVLLCLVAPAVLSLVIAGVGLLAPRSGAALHSATLGVLVGAFVLIASKRWLDADLVLLGLALISGRAFSMLYTRVPRVRDFAGWLSPAVVLVPALFLATPAIARMFAQDSAVAQVAAVPEHPVPVVIVVFDELPLLSLLDAQANIDASQYPNFARLAANGTWFRNATTVAHNTFFAIPAILTGRMPDPSRLPTASDHPESLFTLLGGSHDLHVFESGTAVCPQSLCAPNSGAMLSGSAHQLALVSDAAVVYLHALLPIGLADDLPVLNQGWAGFRASPASATAVGAEAEVDQSIRKAVLADREAVVHTFIESIAPSTRPVFYLLHSMITHVPWNHLPSGRQHGLGNGTIGLNNVEERWSPDEFLVAQGYQRHLQEVRFADRLLGRALDRLQSAGLYDTALIVVVSDHGGAFRPGDSRRRLTPGSLPEIVSVPLIVKWPGSSTAQVSDAPVETIDIVPTVAEVLKVRLPWKPDGRSLLGPSSTRDRRVMGDGDVSFQVPDSTTAMLAGPLARKLAILQGAGTGGTDTTSLLGGRVDQMVVTSAADLHMRLGRLSVIDVRPGSEPLRVDVQGMVDATATRLPLKAGVAVAIAVDGVVRAVTTTFGAGFLRFTTFLPEESLRPGLNYLQAYVVAGNGRLIKPEGVANGGTN